MTNLVSSNSAYLKELKSKYLELITEGYAETVALQTLSFDKGLYLKLITEDKDFAIKILEARKMRAGFWEAKIIADIDTIPEKDEVSGERLRFEKLQFLARADDPERFGNNSKKQVDINLDLTQFKLLKPEEALKAIQNDPFADVIEAEIVETVDEELL